MKYVLCPGMSYLLEESISLTLKLGSAELNANEISFISRHVIVCFILTLTHLSLASRLWDIGKQNSPRCDAAERGVPSGDILFA